MNSYFILGGLLAFAGLGSYAVWERGDAEHWKAQYATLQASYSLAAQKAKDDAAAQEAKDTAALKLQTSAAITKAQSESLQAKSQLALYLKKGNEVSKGKQDLGHACFSVVIPSEMVPQ